MATTDTYINAQVKEYYGRVLKSRDDLQTNACCTAEDLPPRIKAILKELDPELIERSYGCGAPFPELLEGRTVLDLGCGTGKDVYVAARLVGPDGFVIGVDMTEEQLAVARRHVDSQMRAFGYDQPNVDFRMGYIEDLDCAGIEDDSVDVVISNCVINLSPDKARVFSEIMRVLRPGGELYFSDVFADRRLPAELRDDPVLYGECLSGALYREDFRRIMVDLGCADVREVSGYAITIDSPEIEARIGFANFRSSTIRAFKLDSLEDRCEDYGQVAWYLGTIPDHPHAFALDQGHVFETGKPMLVCGNTAAMLEDTRFALHFRVQGDRATHFGVFDCGEAPGEDTGGCC